MRRRCCCSLLLLATGVAVAEIADYDFICSQICGHERGHCEVVSSSVTEMNVTQTEPYR